MSEPGNVETDMSDDATTPPEPNDDDLKAMLAKRQHAKPNKATWVLLVLLILAIGFTLGSCMQRAANSVGGGAAQPRFPGGGPSGAPGTDSVEVIADPEQPAIASDPAGAIGGRPGGRPGDLTIGTVESINGSTMTITTPDGQTITVEVPEGTSVTSSVEVPLEDLPIGGDVVVRGTIEADGTVTADSVTEAAAGFPGGAQSGGGLRPAP